MNVSVHKIIKELATSEDSHCLTIYMPILRGEELGMQNAVRLKTLLNKARKRLITQGLRPVVARELTQAILRTTEHQQYWDDGSLGLALFASENRMDLFRLPMNFRELCVVGNHFQVTPLLPLEIDGSFVILAVSQKQCRVLRGQRWKIGEVSIGGLPLNLEETTRSTDHQRTIQTHGGLQHGTQRETVFTGQGGIADYNKIAIFDFFRRINEALSRYLSNCHDPLIFAGVRSLFPIYQQVNRYPYLNEQIIEGNPEDLSNQELHDQAWKIALPRLMHSGKESLERCRWQWQLDSSSCSLARILEAAHAGQIKTLVLSPNVCRWGTYDAKSSAFQLTKEQNSASEDLLNLAAIQTLRHGGNVFLDDLDHAGVNELAAAVYRYADSDSSSDQTKVVLKK